MQKTDNVDEYIAGFPDSTQELLQQMRKTIKKVAPDAEEIISYGIPTFYLKGNLVHYAGYNKHIGFYPGAGGIAAFKEQLSVYKGAKGSVQFPLDQPLPLDLVTEIVKFRVQQNLDKAATKKKPASRKSDASSGSFSFLSAPAQRALASKGISSLQELSAFTVNDILALHGMGPSSIPKLQVALKENGLSFKES